MNEITARDYRGREIRVGDYVIDTRGDYNGRVEHVDGLKIQLFGMEEWFRAEEFEIVFDDD